MHEPSRVKSLADSLSHFNVLAGDTDSFAEARAAPVLFAADSAYQLKNRGYLRLSSLICSIARVLRP
jgi:hypothetical protein